MTTLLGAALFLTLLTGTGSAQQPEPARPWTVMVYAAADNNADGPVLTFLDDVRAALDDDAGIELLLFIDRSTGFSNDARSLGADFTGARVYRLRKDSAERLDASSHFPGMGTEEEYEVDSSDPRNVESFVTFCKQRFPARRYGLMIYSHADGRGMCPDEESGRRMSIPQLAREVSEQASVDFLALELCNMAGIEIAYEWRPQRADARGFSADVLVAIPNAGPPLDWDRAFARIRSEGHATAAAGKVFDPATMTAAEFGALVVEEGERGRRAMAARHPDRSAEIAHEAAACYDLGAAGDVKRAVDALAVQLSRVANAKELLEGLRGPGEPSEPDSALSYGGDDTFTDYPYVDLYDLCVRAAACEELGTDAREAARAAASAVDSFVIASFGMDGLAGFQPGRHGVFIVFPDGDAEVGGPFSRSRAWRQFAWYTPLAPSEESGPYGRWAFLSDGATADNGVVENWFELLDAWFDDTSQDPGGSNGYVW